MSNELKPCVHCGGVGEKERWSHVDWDEWRIICGRCGTSSDWYTSLAAAIAAWNARVDDVPEQPQVIKNAEKYKLADNCEPKVIQKAEKYKLADSRERLEADVYGAVHGAYAHEDYIPEDMIFGWLDRQAAITRHECSPEAIDNMLNTIGELEEQLDTTRDVARDFRDERDKLTDKIGEITDEVSELMKKQPYTFDVHDAPGSLRTVGRYIDELIAERDELERANSRQARKIHDVCEINEKLTAERDQLSRDLDAEHALVVQFEHDNEKLRDTCNTLRASVAGLKLTVERFKARESGDARQSG